MTMTVTLKQFTTVKNTKIWLPIALLAVVATMGSPINQQCPVVLHLRPLLEGVSSSSLLSS